MHTLKVLSALLSYPRAETQAAVGEMTEVLESERLIPDRDRAALQGFLAEFAGTELLALQERYVGLFDRGRALSLHLFEHVHGESRDRGRAMVDLMNLYRAHGFEIAARELPDYLPLFLEYLAQRPVAEARALLAEAMHVIALLGARLASRGSPYHVPFDALAGFAGLSAELEAARELAAAEGPDETLVHMDRIWEEEAVSFMPAGGGADCARAAADGAPAPVHWVGRQGVSERGGDDHVVSQ